jgi:hypothetical protein
MTGLLNANLKFKKSKQNNLKNLFSLLRKYDFFQILYFNYNIINNNHILSYYLIFK